MKVEDGRWEMGDGRWAGKEDGPGFARGYGVAGVGGDSETEVVVFFVGADPKPVVISVPLASEGAIAATHFNRVNAAFLLETQ